jgi:F0F1-type ATP synthase alpha subunit
MQLNPAEISELIRSRIEGLGVSADIRNQGTVVSVTDGICRIHGLSDAMQGEMLEFPAGSDGQPTYGLALNLERDSVGAVILGEYEHISEGDTVKCTGRILEVPVGPELKGRVVNALGQPIDGKGAIDAKMSAPIEKIASIATAVLPVWRSPMISSRWPRPIGTIESIDFSPVCTGWLTDWRAITPGAIFSIGIESAALIGPLPSIG